MTSDLSYQVQQTPINGTISVMVPPGSETGYYYIPIANLPWQTSWQELKDHVRTVCFVEHVQINEDSTSGHVVLKGRANFDAAFRLLNGGIFHDRALIADGRNTDSWVLVKHHVDASTPSPKSSTASRHTTASAQPSSPALTQSSSGYSDWPAASASPPYMMVPVMSSPPYHVPCTMPEYTDSTALYGMNGYGLGHSSAMMSPAISCSSGPDYAQIYAPSESYGNGYTLSNGDSNHRESRKQYAVSSSGDAVTIKKRKIIIRQLHPWTNETQIRDLIRHKAGSDASKLQKLDMPLADGQQGVNRGYAFATFETEEAADKVIRRLHNYQYEGRVLEAKHTKEGVSDHQSSHGSRSGNQRHSHHNHHSRRHGDGEKKSKDKDGSHRAAGNGEKKSKSSSSKSEVIIAHGSSPSVSY